MTTQDAARELARWANVRPDREMQEHPLGEFVLLKDAIRFAAQVKADTLAASRLEAPVPQREAQARLEEAEWWAKHYEHGTEQEEQQRIAQLKEQAQALSLPTVTQEREAPVPQRWECPECGYKDMPYPPTSYNICPKCLVEFGNDDRVSTVARREELVKLVEEMEKSAYIPAAQWAKRLAAALGLPSGESQ